MLMNEVTSHPRYCANPLLVVLEHTLFFLPLLNGLMFLQKIDTGIFFRRVSVFAR